MKDPTGLARRCAACLYIPLAAEHKVASVVTVTRSGFLILPFDLASTILAIPVATAGPEGRARNHPVFRPGTP